MFALASWLVGYSYWWNRIRHDVTFAGLPVYEYFSVSAHQNRSKFRLTFCDQLTFENLPKRRIHHYFYRLNGIFSFKFCVVSFSGFILRRTWLFH